MYRIWIEYFQFQLVRRALTRAWIDVRYDLIDGFVIIFWLCNYITQKY